MSKLASLHAGLIARKGEAVPAIAHPAHSYVDAPRPAPPPVRPDADPFERRSFAAPIAPPRGFAPMTDQPTPRGPVDAPPSAPEPVHVVASAPLPPAPEPVRAAPRPSADDHAKPYRLTFRMTADQRRRLRIAAAKEEVSLQELLSDALDSHLDTLCACNLRDCACLAREAVQHDAH